jgi:RNA polymerase sigma-70 factor, ECF subfamily
VAELPPKERACVLLKDVLDYPLAEIAGIVDSTLGGVKAALHRGRAKLRELQDSPTRAELDRQERKLLEAYIECFNRQDWDALRRLIQADARVELVGVTEFPVLEVGAPYFSNYSALPWEWRLSLARVDGEPLIVHWQKIGGEWLPRAAVRLWWRDGKVARIRDYVHVDYLLEHSRTVTLSPGFAQGELREGGMTQGMPPSLRSG